ncbi:GNAT family N-acetyltransferase [Streptomyces sp. NBC_00335]|uniref:GNAT family N-acetyltransferase n=1 Tax=unclassified Streptomyces TaxID=2593676 RepID=UPI002256B042|nr:MULTISPECIES: GNAT family N-acetyltransferase [unclassified Streptomyces]MCX5406348.1 GNAT family N-acetyltransferase [Streptomyces sp. NBC_00086]
MTDAPITPPTTPRADPIPPVAPPGGMAALAQPSYDLPCGLRLRPWEPYDAPALVAAYADPDIRHWNRPDPLTEDRAVTRIARWRERWHAERSAVWALAPAEGGSAVGLIGLADIDLRGGSGEFVYWLLPAGRGAGATTEGLAVLTRWAFGELGLHRLRITHSTANPASCRVALNSGYPLEGTMRGALLHADGWHDEHLHARLSTD